MSEKKNQTTEYIQDLSHELLTPLAIIRSKAELLLQSPNLKEDDLNNIDAILKTVQRMIKLNQSLILLSKLDNKVFVDTTSFDVANLVTDSLEKFEDLIRMKNLTVRIDKGADQLIVANLNVMEILISNLIKNAVFHNHSSGHVKIYCDQSKFKISNSSQSVPDGDLFARFNSSNSDANSLGLGLSIVKKICEVMQYRIEQHFENGVFSIQVSF